MAHIEHVIVLALENRSFDHMLGYLDHPKPDRFDGVKHEGLANPDPADRRTVQPSPEAERTLATDPDHSHDAVMEQLAVRGIGPRRRATNLGFIASYERKCRGLAAPRFAGLFGPLVNWWNSRSAAAVLENQGPLIMRCQPQKQVPVLSTLAAEFAVCTRWFCSVPGETWPNRNFMHAATADGETNIAVRMYDDRTIFELLEDAGKTWHVYHDDIPQVWAFPRLWNQRERHANWFPFARFAEHVAAGRLPNYSFIEPNHNPPVHIPGHPPNAGNSQHPGNNTESDADFTQGEALIATIYEALRANPEVFDRSLFLITYDEHGGFYDHVPPPGGVPNPGDPPSRLGKILRCLWHKKTEAFDFTMLGPRVPAVVVSPCVPAGHVDDTVHDHASIPATLRKVFAPDAKPLTRRDAWAAPFDSVASLDAPRTDLPNLSAYATEHQAIAAPALAADRPEEVPGYFEEFVRQTELVRRELVDLGEEEFGDQRAPATTLPRASAVSQAFLVAADRHRER
jgi:phospholipase C